MAVCPKCGYKLRLIDWKPNCPKCGVNLNYYGADKKLQEEADVAEVEHARIQKKIDRLKASFVGSPLTIARIILSVLPLGALMLPLCTVSYSGPLIEQTTEKINAVTIVNLVSSLDFGKLGTMAGSSLLGKGFIGYAVALIALLLSMVMLVVGLVALMAAMGPKGNIRNIFNNCASLVMAGVSAAAFSVFSKEIASVFPEFFSGKLNFGIFVYMALILVLLALNIYLTINKVQVKYKQCYVGGIPVEEFQEELEKGTSIEELHKRMDVILAEREAERAAEAAKKEAERKAKEEAELAKKAGKL